MKPISQHEVVSRLAAFLKTGMVENATGESPDDVVLPDECGDSLWDKVLGQQDKIGADENTLKNGDLREHKPAQGSDAGDEPTS